MSNTSVKEITVHTDDLSPKSLAGMRFFSAMGALALIAVIIMRIFSVDSAWLHLAGFMLAAIGLLMTSVNSLGNVISGDEENRDEWQQNLALKARAISYVMVHVSLVLTYIVFRILSHFEVDISVSGNDTTIIVIGLAFLLFMLPRAVMSWIVTPVIDDTDELAREDDRIISKSISKESIKLVTIFAIAFIASLLIASMLKT